MKRKNLKLAIQLDSNLDKIDEELNKWEKSKYIDGSPIIQTRREPLNSEYFKIDLNKIPFEDLRTQALKSLNKKRDHIEKELFKLMEDEN